MGGTFSRSRGERRYSQGLLVHVWFGCLFTVGVDFHPKGTAEGLAFPLCLQAFKALWPAANCRRNAQQPGEQLWQRRSPQQP